MATFTWISSTSGDWAAPGAWSGGVPDASDADVTIAAPGSYTIALAANASFTLATLRLAAPGATLAIAGTLNAGGALVLRSGRFQLAGGTLRGGTIVSAGATVLMPGGTLDGVTVADTLDLRGSAYVSLRNGLTAGTINAAGVQFSVLDSETLKAVTLALGSVLIGPPSGLQLQDRSSTLTLGATSALIVTGSAFVSGGQAFVNAGRITVAPGATLITGDTALSNTGSITVDHGRLIVNGGFANTGDIVVAGGTLALNSNVTLGALLAGSITVQSGLLLLGGALDLGGATLDLAAGTAFANLSLSGSIVGGTLREAGGLLAFAAGTLDAITLDGGLTIGAGTAYIRDGLAGTGPITVAGGTIGFLDSTTLDGFTVTLDGGALIDNAWQGTLTLGSGTTLVTHASVTIGGASTLRNLGTIDIAAATVTLGGPGVINTGLITLSGGTLTAALTASAQDIGGITIQTPGIFANAWDGGIIRGFGTIQGPLVNAGTIEARGGLLVINGLAGQGTLLVDPGATLEIDGPGGSATLYGLDQGGGQPQPCFASGTRIMTAHGPVAVEHLGVGDLVPAALSCRMARVMWIGHRAVDCRRMIDIHRADRAADIWPVRIAGEAFGPGLPTRALVLSPDHAVLVDSRLVPVRYLVNGATITQAAAGLVTYWHIELEWPEDPGVPIHEVLLAEGLPAESYLDTGNRGSFDGGGSAVALRPDAAWNHWAQKSCAPLVTSGAVVTDAKARLIAQAVMLGHTTTDDPALAIETEGQILRAERLGDRYRFTLPAQQPHGPVHLVSRAMVPAHLAADSADHRRLGVAVVRLLVNGSELAPRFGRGWYASETDWQWTDGRAAVDGAPGAVIDVTILPLVRYWLTPADA